MNLRKEIFWFLDWIKGSPQKQLLRKTEALLSSKDNVWLKNQLDSQLQILLTHAKTSVAFYQYKAYHKLSDFPIINKNIIRENYKDFISKKYAIGNCKEVFTSGSTGTPFKLYQNIEKVQKINADNMWFSSKANYTIGDPLIFIRAWVFELTLKIKLDYFKKNITPLSTFDVIEKGIPKILKILNSKGKSLSLMLYGSTLEQICKYLDEQEENPIKFKTKSIITISDSLSDYAVYAAKRYFSVKPLSRYSNTESGILAQQLPNSEGRFRINNSSFIIEIFDLDKDVLLPYGEAGRIVVTDLYNFAMPLIRYDTGDIGIMDIDVDGTPYLNEIHGRKVDQLFTTNGKLLPSLYMASFLLKIKGIKQYQIIQKSRIEYQINLNTKSKFETSELINKYKLYLGEDAVIKINFVDDIPLLSSGKRRLVVNEFYN